MSVTRRPTTLTHEGVVLTERAWVPFTRGREVAEARVWDHVEPGVRVEQSELGFLIRFPGPRPVDARTGLVPLVPIEGRWCAVPLHPRDVAAHPPDSVLLVQGFEARTVVWKPVDLADWIDLGDVPLVTVSPLGPPPPPPVEVAAPVSKNVHEVLGVAPPAPGRAPLANALASGRAPGGALAATARTMAGGALGWLARLGRTLFPPEKQGHAEPGPPAKRRGWLGWLETWAAQLGMAGALGRMVGGQHARYLRRMMGLFDAGRWDEALRHGIPLSESPPSDTGGGWLGWLGPRPSLSLSSGQGAGGGRNLGLGEELFEMLRGMYRRAFRALDQAGRVREAAYVLAELLDEVQEAVRYLESKDELRLAAEFAERKALPADQVVRLWFLAGDVDRAVVLARRYEAFAGAIAELEMHEQTAQAAALRTLWAGQEAAAGHYATAAQIAWPVESLRTVARDWLQRAMMVPGVAGATALSRFMARFPAESEVANAALTRLLEHPGAERAREWLGTEWAAEGASVPRWGAVPLARRLVRDLRAHPRKALRATIRGVLRRADAQGFDADLPTLPTRAVPPVVALWKQDPVTYGVEEGDRGTVPIHDVVALPGERWLVALGELGVRLLDHRGRTLRHFATPTTHLVDMPSESMLVLALVIRGEVARVSRFDVLSGELEPWLDLSMQTFAPTFDGHQWFVAEADRVLALDTHARDARVTWSVPDMRAASLAIAEGELQILDHAGELFRYRIPALTLSARSARGGDRRLRSDAGLRVAGPPKLFDDAFPVPEAERVSLCHEVAAVQVRSWADGPEWRVVLFNGLDDMVLRGTVTSAGAERVGFRWLGADLAVWDDIGRIRVVAGATGRLRVDHRV